MRAPTLDSMEINGLVGTIAGDDTAFVLMRDNESAQALYNEIEELLIKGGVRGSFPNRRTPCLMNCI